MRRQTSSSICSLCATRGEFLALSVAGFLMWANRTITKSGSPRSVKAPHLDAKWDIPPGTPLAAVSVFEVQTRNQPQGTEVESRAGRPKSRASQLLSTLRCLVGLGRLPASLANPREQGPQRFHSAWPRIHPSQDKLREGLACFRGGREMR